VYTTVANFKHFYTQKQACSGFHWSLKWCNMGG